MKPAPRLAKRQPWWREGLLPALGMLALLAAASLPTTRPAYAWGPEAHRPCNDWAIGTLAAGVRGFFQANRSFILAHSNDPEEWTKKDRYERMRHYIYLDKYGIFPYLELPHSYRAAGRNRLSWGQ